MRNVSAYDADRGKKEERNYLCMYLTVPNYIGCLAARDPGPRTYID